MYTVDLNTHVLLEYHGLQSVYIGYAETCSVTVYAPVQHITTLTLYTNTLYNMC